MYQELEASGRVRAVECTSSIVIIEIVNGESCCCRVYNTREMLPGEVDGVVECEVATINTGDDPLDASVLRNLVRLKAVT